MEKFLTIVIPTYNRENQLIRLLRSIERQNAVHLYYIVILNNHSDYDVEASVRNHFKGAFIDNIEIYNRPYNAGGDYNIASAFLFAKSPFMWIIGDDDEVLDDCFNIICEDVARYPDLPCFKYHIEGHSTYNSDVLVDKINIFSELHKKKYFTAGDIIFVSNNIYNLPQLGNDYISSVLYYSYCSVPHALPMLRCLIDEKKFLMSHREIIKYNAPEGDHWNYIKIAMSLSTVLDINYDNRYDVVTKFLNIISEHFPTSEFLEECLHIEDKRYRKYVRNKGLSALCKENKAYNLFCTFLYWIESFLGIHLLSLFVRYESSIDDFIKTRKRRIFNFLYDIALSVYKPFRFFLKN